MNQKPNILFLVPADYASLQTKGVAPMILERDENGYFDKVITVHLLTNLNQEIKLNNHHIVYEYDLRKYLYPTKKTCILLPLLPVRMLFVLLKLLRLIRQYHINIIRANDAYLMGLFAWLLSIICRIPFCISIHNDNEKLFALNPQKGFKKLLRLCSAWLPNFLFPKANKLLPISEYLRKTVLKNINDSNIAIIRHGIDMDFKIDTKIKEKLALPEDKKIISFVGRLSKEKYIDDLLQAIRLLSTSRNDFAIVIVGIGELEAEINDWLVANSDISSCVHLLGYQPNPIVISLHYYSDVSIGNMGGISLIESCAVACPIVAYDVEWTNELIIHKETGLLVPERDVVTLVQSICYLLDNPDEAKRMGAAAKKLAFKYHDICNTTQQKRRCYQEILTTT